MVLGRRWAEMATTLLGSGAMLLAETVWPRNSMLVFPNSYFSVLAVRRATLRRMNVSCRCWRWSSSILMNTRMSSRYGEAFNTLLRVWRGSGIFGVRVSWVKYQ